MRTPAFWYKPFGWLAALLWPLSLVYRLGRWLHVGMSRPRRFAQPVICIGNLVAGGAGKTPTVQALAALLRDAQPHIVTRGYGRAAGGKAAPRRVAITDTADQVGDEPLLLVADTPTWVARDRTLGIGCAFAAGAGLVLLDDGLQSVKLRAEVNLLVVDGASGFGNGAALPAGPLREMPCGVRRRADALIMIGDDAHNIAKLFPEQPIFRADPVYDTKAFSKAVRYFAFAGLARPEKFFAAARAKGLSLAGTRRYADHHAYTPEDRAELIAAAKAANAQLLTTAKDAVRWPVLQRMALAVLPLRLDFAEPAALRGWLQTRCPEIRPEAFAGSVNG